ncbi:MAG TPA: VOC family protein [Dongiaceae bacterium]|nr:VOC family protein [Dongiaceae bacterium]
MSAIPKPGAVIFAKNVAAMAAFYATVFSLSLKHSEPEKVVLESATLMLVVHGIPEEIAENIVITQPPQLRDNTALKLFLPVESIAVARAVAAASGGAIEDESYEWSAGNFRACDGFDPEGNVFQVRELIK